MKKKYYAIAKGRKTGIFYDTWDQVEPLVWGFSGAQYKAFIVEDDAEDWLRRHTPQT